MFNLSELIDKFYLDKQRDREQKHFYITDAGRCPRAVFFKFKNAPKAEMEARILRLFDHGDSIHQLIMKPLLSMRDVHVVAAEVDIPPQEIISGRADAIISDTKDLYVLDIKSMNGMVFNNLKEPKSENIDQIQLYLYYFRIPKGILLYVNKDTQELKEFIVERDEKRAKALLARLGVLKTEIEKNIIPERIPEYPAGWQCKYCPFIEICRMVNGGKVKWEEFKKKIELRQQGSANA